MSLEIKGTSNFMINNLMCCMMRRLSYKLTTQTQEKENHKSKQKKSARHCLSITSQRETLSK